MFLTHLHCTARTDYEVHQHLHHLFQSDERVYLWRWAESRDHVVILSGIKPIDTVPCREIGIADIESGRPMSFAMQFVAARCKSRDGKIGAKVPLRGMRERREWLTAKLGAAGIRLLFSQIDDVDIVIGDGYVMHGAEATGMVAIDDRARAAAHIQAGFGRNRAFGCGLLWLPEIMA